jgi:hypothetical protein
MSCPICSNASVMPYEKEPDQRAIDCDRCRPYAVDHSRWARFLKLPFEEKIDALEKAKRRAKPGERPVVTYLEVLSGVTMFAS